MRKIMTTMGLGLALSLGAAGAAAAQSPRPDTNRPDSVQRQRGERTDRGDRAQRGERRRGGPEFALLRGITLTDAQKAHLETLRRDQRTQMQQAREKYGPAMKEAREARQRGDTATARAKMEQMRTEMTRQREQHIAALRGILTPEQQKQFDANVAAWKERAAKGGARGEHGMRHGRRRGGDQPRTDRNDRGR